MVFGKPDSESNLIQTEMLLSGLGKRLGSSTWQCPSILGAVKMPVP
jgi:hypothetical protein